LCYIDTLLIVKAGKYTLFGYRNVNKAEACERKHLERHGDILNDLPKVRKALIF
jgi:hypothetical protein